MEDCSRFVKHPKPSVLRRVLLLASSVCEVKATLRLGRSPKAPERRGPVADQCAEAKSADDGNRIWNSLPEQRITVFERSQKSVAAMWTTAAESRPVESLPEPVGEWTRDHAAATCFSLAPDWYPPVLAGGRTLEEWLFAAGLIEEAAALTERLSPDDYGTYVTTWYREGLARYGSSWRYADIVTALLAASHRLVPKRYLEIGVRRGRSLCAVASQAPDCALYGFDLWVSNYAGIENPGPEFVRTELDRVGHRGSVQFVNGNSHQTLPAFFAAHPDLTFDLITVDGDHSTLGAAQDICDVIPRLRIGGILVFDDVCHPALPGLRQVWQELVASQPRFSAVTFDEAGYGVGMAIRRF